MSDAETDLDLVERIKAVRHEILKHEAVEREMDMQLRVVRKLLKAYREDELGLLNELAEPKPMPLFEAPVIPETAPVIPETAPVIPPGQPAGTVGHDLGCRTVSETQRNATPPDDWRSIPLNRLMRDREAGEWLAKTYELHTVGDVYDMERDGDSLNDLGVKDEWREKLRAALLKLRADRGWGPDEGYPAAWLEHDPLSPLSVECVQCGAKPGVVCFHSGGEPHSKRVRAARRKADQAAKQSQPIDLCQFHDPPPPPDPDIDSLAVACPHCGARAGAPCINDGSFKGTHTPRHERAKREARKAARRAELEPKAPYTDDDNASSLPMSDGPGEPEPRDRFSEDLSWLTHTPAGDVNFKSTLAKADTAVLMAAMLDVPTKTARKAIEAEIKRRDKKARA